jgi:AcrR family transcriptional regulator
MKSYDRMKSSDAARDRLLAVARDLFTRRGYEETSVRDLTSRAKANLGAVTYHFGSKEQLYHEAIASMAEPMAERVAAAASSTGTPLKRIGTIVRAFLDHVTENPGAPTCLLRELASERPIPPPLAAVMRRNFSAIAQAIGEGQKDGSIRGGDPRLLTLNVVSQVFYLAVAGRLLKDVLALDLKEPATRERVIDHAVETICHSLESQKAST